MITDKIKKNNIKQLEYVSRDMQALAERLRLCNPSNPNDKDRLGSSIVETSFFVNAYGIAATAFRKMITDLNENGEAQGDVLYYLFKEVDTFREEIEKVKESSLDN